MDLTKHAVFRGIRVWISVFLCLFLFCSCQSSDEKAVRAAASAVFERIQSCDLSQVSVIMGREVSTLSDMEQFTLRRLQYKIISSDIHDATHMDLVVDTSVYDIMTLLNESLLYAYQNIGNPAFSTVSTWALERLNTGDVKVGSFRAVMPFCKDAGGSWSLDAGRIGDDLRDAITGGAFSWFEAYAEVFGDSSTDTGDA